MRKSSVESFRDLVQANPEDYFDDSIYDDLELPDVQISTGPTREVDILCEKMMRQTGNPLGK